MSRTTRKHVRVFYVDLKRDYADVWYDPTCLSTWLRLLVASDEAWPSTPELPPAVRRADLAKLTTCGLLAMHGKVFELKGYRVEREGRAEAGRKGANALHSHSGRTANAGAVALPVSEDQRIRGSERSTDPLTYTARPRQQRLVDPVGEPA